MGTLCTGTFAYTDRMWRLVLLLVTVFVTGSQGQCPSNVKNMTGVSDWSAETGCVFADTDEKERYDTYDRALELCKKVLGPNGRLAEILSAEDQNSPPASSNVRRVCLSSRIPNCHTGGVDSRIWMMTECGAGRTVEYQ